MSVAPFGPVEIGAPLAPRTAFIVLLVVVVLLAGYVSLCYLFHLSAIFAGGFFLFFWLGVEKASPAAFIPTLLGALGGIANASLLHPSLATAFALDPGLAAVGGLVVLAAAIYMLLIHKGSILINQSYMLFFTVAAMPQLSDPEIFVSMVACVFLASAYFGGIWWIGRLIAARVGNA